MASHQKCTSQSIPLDDVINRTCPHSLAYSLFIYFIYIVVADGFGGANFNVYLAVSWDRYLTVSRDRYI